ncbi:MAG: hypothetical protein OIN84_19770 [Candidatus Methanoperedens sp.]|nr:hypothetical protein [Candidatus Methanoperedens sp.]
MLKSASRTEKQMTRFIVSSLILLAIVALLLVGGTVAIVGHLSSQIELVALQKADADAVRAREEGFMPKIVVAGQVEGNEWDNGQLVIVHASVVEDSLIFITPTTKPRGNWWVTNLIPGESFTVESSADDENMSFNWLIADLPQQAG